MESPNSQPELHQAATAEVLANSAYARLRTFRADESAVDCPVWFATSEDNSVLWFRSKTATAKVRRIRRNPYVEMQACDWQGRPRSGGGIVHGQAEVIPESSPSWAEADATLHAKYGWKWNTVPLFRLPMTNTVKTDMSMWEKLRHIRHGRAVPDSSLIVVRVAPPGATPPDGLSKIVSPPRPHHPRRSPPRSTLCRDP